jgi:hypothetical protein
MPPPLIGIIPIDEIPIRQYPKDETPIPDVIMQPFPETNIRIQPQDIVNQGLVGGGGGGTINTGRGIVIDRNRGGGISYDDYFTNQIENIPVQE